MLMGVILFMGLSFSSFILSKGIFHRWFRSDLLIVGERFGERSVGLVLCAQPLETGAKRLDLRVSSSEVFPLLRNYGFLSGNSTLQLRHARPLFSNFFVFLKELVKQHRVYLVIAYAVSLAFLVAHHQVGVDLFYILRYQP